MHPPDSTDERFEKLEVKLAYSEQAVQELSDLVFGQQRQIDQLRELCQRLALRIEALSSDAAPASPADEQPPHY